MPYDHDEALGSLQPAQREELPRLRAGRSPDLERDYAQARAELLDDPLRGLSEPMATLSAREQAWAGRPWFREVLAADLREAVTTGFEGYLEDGLSCVRPLEVEVSSVRCPVRAVHGSVDDWEPLANLQRVLVDVADAQLFVLDGLNHFGPLMYPDLLVSLCISDS
jgi:hypothetical protein